MIIERCICGKFPIIEEILTGWKAFCPNCTQFVVGLATSNEAIDAWNKVNRKNEQVELALAGLLEEVLQRGFNGTASVKICVQDGVIQHIYHKIKRLL